MTVFDGKLRPVERLGAAKILCFELDLSLPPPSYVKGARSRWRVDTAIVFMEELVRKTRESCQKHFLTRARDYNLICKGPGRKMWLNLAFLC